VADQSCSEQRSAALESKQKVELLAEEVQSLASSSAQLKSEWDAAKSDVEKTANELSAEAQKMLSIEDTIRIGRNVLAEAIKTGSLTSSQRSQLETSLQLNIQRLKEFQAAYDAKSASFEESVSDANEAYDALKSNIEKYKASQTALAAATVDLDKKVDALNTCLTQTQDAKQRIQEQEQVLSTPSSNDESKDQAAADIGTNQGILNTLSGGGS
jgi:chromosome segregation ATPase